MKSRLAQQAVPPRLQAVLANVPLLGWKGNLLLGVVIRNTHLAPLLWSACPLRRMLHPALMEGGVFSVSTLLM